MHSVSLKPCWNTVNMKGNRSLLKEGCPTLLSPWPYGLPLGGERLRLQNIYKKKAIRSNKGRKWASSTQETLRNSPRSKFESCTQKKRENINWIHTIIDILEPRFDASFLLCYLTLEPALTLGYSTLTVLPWPCCSPRADNSRTREGKKWFTDYCARVSTQSSVWIPDGLLDTWYTVFEFCTKWNYWGKPQGPIPRWNRCARSNILTSYR